MTTDFVGVSTWIENLEFDWTEYMKYGNKIQLSKHQYVYHQGNSIQSIYVILSGRIRLSLVNLSGEEKTIAIVGRNGIIGEIGVFEGGGYATSAITAAGSTLQVFEKDVFIDIALSNPNLTAFTMANMGRKFRILAGQSLNLAYTSAQYRVVRLLSELGNTYGVPCSMGLKISIKFTHQEMANLAGTTRVTVAQVFSQLERQGFVIRENGYCVIVSPERMEGLLCNPKSSHFRFSTGNT